MGDVQVLGNMRVPQVCRGRGLLQEQAIPIVKDLVGFKTEMYKVCGRDIAAVERHYTTLTFTYKAIQAAIQASKNAQRNELR